MDTQAPSYETRDSKASRPSVRVKKIVWSKDGHWSVIDLPRRRQGLLALFGTARPVTSSPAPSHPLGPDLHQQGRSSNPIGCSSTNTHGANTAGALLEAADSLSRPAPDTPVRVAVVLHELGEEEAGKKMRRSPRLVLLAQLHRDRRIACHRSRPTTRQHEGNHIRHGSGERNASSPSLSPSSLFRRILSGTPPGSHGCLQGNSAPFLPTYRSPVPKCMPPSVNENR